MTKYRTTWIFGAVIGALCVVCAVSAMYLLEARASAWDAEANLARMTKLVERIEELRKLEDQAQMQGEQKIENSQAWIELARAVAINEQQISEISRLPLQKLKSANYSRDDVVLRVNSVSAEQVATFLVKCIEVTSGYQPTSVHLRKMPSNSQADERWSSELVLTRILYTATNQTPGK